MKKEEASKIIQRQLSAIDDLRKLTVSSPEFSKWRRDTEVAIENIFPGKGRHLRDFRDIKPYLLFTYPSTTPAERHQAYLDGLERYAALLKSLLDEIRDFWPSESEANPIVAPSASAEQSSGAVPAASPSVVERLKNHWFGSAIILAAVVAGATWSIEYYLYVAPRDYTIQALRADNEQLRQQLSKVPISKPTDPILPPAWLHHNIATPFLGQQASITATSIDRSANRAAFRLVLPNQTIEPTVQFGHAFEFEYAGSSYVLHILQFSSSPAEPAQVQVSIGRVQP